MGILILLVLSTVLLSLPAVQTSLAKRATNYLNERYQVQISLERIRISPFSGKIFAKGVYIEDHHQDTLAYISSLSTALLNLKEASEGNLKFSGLKAEELTFVIRNYKNENYTNLDLFVERLDSGPTDPNAPPFFMSVEEMEIENSSFTMIDDNLENPLILQFKTLDASAQNFIIKGSNVSTRIHDVHFISDKGIEVEKLELDFAYSKSEMSLRSLELETSYSSLKGEVLFEYEREDFEDFFDRVQLKGYFEDSRLSGKDLNVYYDEFGSDSQILLNTQFHGVLNELVLKEARVDVSGNSLSGDLEFVNLFESNLPFHIDARLDQLNVSRFRLSRFMPRVIGDNLPEQLSRLGEVQGKGTIGVGENVIDADFALTTSLGSGDFDMVLQNYDNAREVTYSGLIQLQDFDLGKFLDYNGLGSTSLKMNVDGKGFEKASLNTEVIGEVYHLTYNKYDYENISVTGLIKDELFDGEVIVRDENFDVDFEGLADLSGRTNRFNFRAAVREAQLNRINLFTRDSIAVFRGNILMDVEGRNLDDFVGDLSFYNTSFKNQNDEYYFEDFRVSSRFEEGEHILDFDSPDIITGYLRGKFLMGELSNLILNSLGSIYTNYDPYPLSPGQYLNFDLKVYNKIIDVLIPELEFGSNTFLKGSMSADDGDFKLSFRSPHIAAYNNEFDEVNLNIDNKNPLFNTYVEVGKIRTKVYDISDFTLINTKLKDTLFFRTEFKGGETFTDEYALNFYHTFNEQQRSVIGLKKSELGFKGNRWVINETNDRKNKVIFNKALDSISIEALVMNYGEEQILLEGTLIDSTYKDIDLEFSKVALSKITPDIDSLALGGTVDGYLNILQRNNNYVPSSNVKVSNFSVNGFVLGNLFLSLIGNENLTNFGVNAKIVNRSREVVNILGDINYVDQTSRLKLNGVLDNFNLAPFSALGSDVIDRLRGYASGRFSIGGSLSDPDINGKLQLSDAGFHIPLLNLDLKLNPLSEVDLSKQSFRFNNLTLTDTQFNTSAGLSGAISHDGFEDWYLDLNIKTLGERFLVLNTAFEEGALYYGTGFISGQSRIYGLVDELLNIEVEGRTERGTVFKIPVSDETEIGDFSFINFIEKNKAKEGVLVRQLADVQGVEMNFDLDVTPRAEIEIVIDSKTGSSLKGTGAGNLLIEINTNGKFQMWGDFITVTGEYNFKYGGVIDKRFKVEPNGTIEWNGDPLQANMNIDARYSLFANPSTLLDNAQYSRKIETDVFIHLSGELMKPSFEYEIRFPTANAVTNSELQYRLEDQATRELQAFSLLSQGVFINQFSITQGAVTGNLVQTASNMFNEILNSGDGKFDVGVTYDIGERNPQKDFVSDDRLGVTVSTQISDRILINGKVGVPVGGVTESVVAGNVEVQILLNEDGTLSATIFNRENEITQFFAQQQGYTQGVGLSYQVEFDTMRELFQKLFARKEEEATGAAKSSPLETQGKDSSNAAPARTMGNGMVRIQQKPPGS